MKAINQLCCGWEKMLVCGGPGNQTSALMALWYGVRFICRIEVVGSVPGQGIPKLILVAHMRIPCSTLPANTTTSLGRRQ
ncbi:hypothetical protein DPMN_055402 [Dreissena polymorpha]|uniref:Uncharacterized protein n=1 Tax=Dreissena polymorpha TaxID=45954 RepID=A0A9D4HSI1_DREPO|nr:hypothetical protein DPMN_055402 [Dreissena polymorpha]